MKQEPTPGPSDYAVLKEKGGPHFSLVGKNNYNSYKDKVPGPGEYQTERIKEEPLWKYKFGASKREQKKSKEKQPGPSEYDPKVKIETAKFSFGKEIKFLNKLQEKPGPGHYYIPCSIVELPKFVRVKGDFDPQYKVV